jgi:hypothetical protein
MVQSTSLADIRQDLLLKEQEDRRMRIQHYLRAASDAVEPQDALRFRSLAEHLVAANNPSPKSTMGAGQAALRDLLAQQRSSY